MKNDDDLNCFFLYILYINKKYMFIYIWNTKSLIQWWWTFPTIKYKKKKCAVYFTIHSSEATNNKIYFDSLKWTTNIYRKWKIGISTQNTETQKLFCESNIFCVLWIYSSTRNEKKKNFHIARSLLAFELKQQPTNVMCLLLSLISTRLSCGVCCCWVSVGAFVEHLFLLAFHRLRGFVIATFLHTHVILFFIYSHCSMTSLFDHLHFKSRVVAW